MRMREQGVRWCTMALYSWVLLMSFITIGVNGDWIPKLDDTVTPAKWETLLQNFDVSTSYQTCRTVHSSKGLHKFLSIFSTKPVTYVVTGDGEGKMDIKFKDSNYIFDQKLQLSKEKYMIVPPYQPVEWMWVRFNGDIAICAYEDSQVSLDPLSTSAPSAVSPASGCECASTLKGLPSTASSYAASFPHTIRKPEMPFFLTADVTPAQDDVTICTILTVDRLLRISQMSDFWGGPISAAVFLHDLSEVSVVMDWYLSNNTLRRHVDIHLVYDDKIVAFELPDRPFPVNILRNVAIRFARTANVFYIEGDFIPSPDLYPNLGPIKKRLADGEKTVFIVAPFSSDKADFDMKLFPKDKQSLQKMALGGGLIRDLSYFNSHAAFDFNKWYRSTEVYTMPFAGGYEPYYIGPKSYPLFEEIFIGCGADKVSHPTELNAAGYSFNVLPTGFIVHIDSTGMGSAWCRGWAGNERSTMKWEAFTTKIGSIYRSNPGTSYDSRVPWWDIAPVAVTKAGVIAPAAHNDEVCEAPPPKDKEEKVCPPCNQPAISPDELKCPEDTKSKQELDTSKLKVKRLEDDLTKKKLEVSNLEDSVKALRKETERLQDYSKFVVNLSVGVVVVMIVVLGVGICIWPRGKKVWVLPTWKDDHHSL